MVLVEKYGADAFRYYLMSSPVIKGEGVNFDDKELEDVYKKCISRLENVVTLYAMNKEGETMHTTVSDNVLDRWMVARVHELVSSATNGYDNYLLDDATRGIGDIIDDISVWYTRRSRDRLKGVTGDEDKKKAYETLSYTLLTLAKVMAPVMPFIAERVYQAIGGSKESVHLEKWPEGGAIDEHIVKEMKEVRDLVSLGLMKRTENKINVKQPLLSVSFNKVVAKEYFDLIADELNVKEVIVTLNQVEDVVLDTTITKELEQEGDVRKLIRAVQDMRKEKGLQPSDEVKLVISSTAGLGDLSLLLSTCKIKEIKEDADVSKVKVELSHGNVSISLTSHT
jgi:isoleucyl-tRNA synthetase